jgi:hypothetical protein
MEKSSDIEYLEKSLEKLKKQNEGLLSDKDNLEKKLVSIEIDNNDLLSKARELEYWADELKTKLDAALEENIILHNEADTYKAESEEAMQRLQEEIEDLKNEVSSNEKIINRLTMHRDFLLKNSYSTKDDLTDNQFNSLRASYSLAKFSPTTPLDSKKVPEKFMQTYSKTFLNTENIIDKKYSEDKTSSFLIPKGLYDKNDIDKDEEEETEFIRQKIDTEIKNILDNRRNFILNTLTQENFSFDVIQIQDSQPSKKNKVQNLKLLDEVLAKVQARKEKVTSQKKMMQVKLEKIGVKIL